MGLFRRGAQKAPPAELRPGLRVLAIADARPSLSGLTLPEFVSQRKVNLVITGGDLHRTDIEGADRLTIPVFGVYGNHCDGNYLADLGITNLHLATVEVAGVTFTGLQGCVRYKEGTRDVLYTQDEYANLVRHLPAADVVVTHCPPAGINDHPADPAHVGITALRHWLDVTAPRLLIHGHTYPKEPVTAYGDTRIEYVRGARILTI
jgi:Icc-related predicted phosphoesterase